MGVEVRVEIAAADHARAVAERMRPEDAAEVEAAAGQTPLEALEEALRISPHAYAVSLDGELVALCGLAPCEGHPEGRVVWCLTSTSADRHPRLFARLSRGMLLNLADLAWGEGAEWIGNFVDARYTRALRWAGWLGFTVGDPIPCGRAGLPFHPVFYRRPAWVPPPSP